MISHGASPRILKASVAGTRGSRTVTGSQLRGSFELSTTYASFTTISTAASRRSISGSVYRAPRRGTLLVQGRSGRSWRTLNTEVIGAGGACAGPLTGPGRYRVVYDHLGGPAVAAR